MREGTCWHGDTGTRGIRNTRGPEAQRLGWPEEAELKGGTMGRPVIGWGIHFRVSGDGHGHREFRCRPFGHRELAPGFRRLKAERLIPVRLTTVAVTRHLE